MHLWVFGSTLHIKRDSTFLGLIHCNWFFEISSMRIAPYKTLDCFKVEENQFVPLLTPLFFGWTISSSLPNLNICMYNSRDIKWGIYTVHTVNWFSWDNSFELSQRQQLPEIFPYMLLSQDNNNYIGFSRALNIFGKLMIQKNGITFRRIKSERVVPFKGRW